MFFRTTRVKRPDGTAIRPDDDPPSLAHIADKTTRDWVYAWIKDPQSYASTATMPNYHLRDDDARDISAYIMAQSTPMQPALASVAAQASPDIAAGTTLYGQSFCASCHATQNAAGMMVGGNVGPELTGIGTKAKPEWLYDWVSNPDHYDPNTMMPRYRFDAKQVVLLVGFLESKTEPDFVANVHLDAATPQQIEYGERLVMENGCASCHQINGIKQAGELRTRTHSNRQQATQSAGVCAPRETHAARLRWRQDRQSARLRAVTQNAPIQPDADAD